MRLISRAFRSTKPLNPKAPKSPPASGTSTDNDCSNLNTTSRSRSRSWCVYLILSTNTPIKTYVGSTNNFSRRLKQHNGEIKGGAKASRVGRPWVCACIVQGFNNQSEACAFEAKWKSLSRKLPYRRRNELENDERSSQLLQHRHKALDKVKALLDGNSLEIEWQAPISFRI